jgi:GT2 family glycosyltransferase
MDVSIIVVNYNTEALLSRCLTAVFEKTAGLDFEVIVVDNASSDCSTQMVKDRFPSVRLIESSVNLGFGQANNLAFRIAEGKYIFLLNSDAILLNNAVLQFFTRAQASSPETGCWGTVLENERGEKIHSFWRFPTVGSLIWSSLKVYLPGNAKMPGFKEQNFYSQKEFRVDYITGADLFIRKSLIDEIGFFDAAFFMYFEETDFQLRASKSGYKSMITDGPRIMHLEGGSLKTGEKKRSYLKTKYYLESTLRYIKKHNANQKYLCFRFFYAVFRLPAILLMKLSAKEKLSLIKILVTARAHL